MQQVRCVAVVRGVAGRMVLQRFRFDTMVARQVVFQVSLGAESELAARALKNLHGVHLLDEWYQSVCDTYSQLF